MARTQPLPKALDVADGERLADGRGEVDPAGEHVPRASSGASWPIGSSRVSSTSASISVRSYPRPWTLENVPAFRSTGHPLESALGSRDGAIDSDHGRFGFRGDDDGLDSAWQARRGDARRAPQHESLPCAGAGDGERGFRQQPSDHAEPHRSAREQRRAGERIPADAHDRGRADELAQLRDARGRLTGRRSGGLDRLHVRQARDFPVELVAETRSESCRGSRCSARRCPRSPARRSSPRPPRRAARPGGRPPLRRCRARPSA